jgi:uncharacterized protein YyaL (SSP411 family)
VQIDSEDFQRVSDDDKAKELGMHRSRLPLVQIALAGLLGMTSCARAGDDGPAGKGKPANRLAKETSPYLLLHAHNPVDWYPWGPEAFEKAKTEDKPIFLSVGYSSCYWCHVMERESFMDPEIAKVLNANFVCIKVDREERPDVDQIYMTALQAMGPGGWPMSLFLTPDGRPFFGGTYFPPRDRERASGFLTIAGLVGKAWAKDRAEIERAAAAATDAVRRRLESTNGKRKLPLSRTMAAEGQAQLGEQFDPEYGGFGFNPNNPRRPKFPEPANLIFLLDRHRRGGVFPEGADPLKMVLFTLDRMARGGIRDHLGGGYHRYATDRRWLVPHFEKMLYDNAQLASVHLAAYEITQDARWSNEAEATFAFIEQKMTAPEGGFYSALDAESKGEEGAYYVWTPDEVKAALGDQSAVALFAQVYGLAGEPNFEGQRYVLHEPRTRAEQAGTLKTTPAELESRLAPLRARLLAVREQRIAPLCDDKILTGWNGLMIAAYADAYRILKVKKYRDAAERAAGFLLEKLRLPDGRLLRTYREGQAKLPAYLEDYAYLAHGLLRLHHATGAPRWLHDARSLTDRLVADFEDRTLGGFFFTAEGHERLLARAKDLFDNALPSGNSLAILDLLGLYRATRQTSDLEHAGKALGAFGTSLAQIPAAMPLALIGVQEYLDANPAPKALESLATRTPAQATEQVVTAAASLDGNSTRSVAPGGAFDVVVRLSIKHGWHLYANPTGLAEFKPTTIELERSSAQTASLLETKYPAGEQQVLGSIGKEHVALYEQEVELRAHCKLAADAKSGAVTINFVLNYQACNDRLCLAPTTMKIPVRVPVGR